MSASQNAVVHRNHVQFHGSGPETLVLANGFGCQQTIWAPVVEALIQNGAYRVVTFDYTGSGESDVRQYSIERYRDLAGYVQDLIDVCAVAGQPTTVIAHSVSSSIAMLASLESSTAFSRLIAIGPSPHFLNDGEYRGGFEREDIDELLTLLGHNRQHWSEYMASKTIGTPQSGAPTQRLQAQFDNGDPYILHRFGQVTFLSDIRSKLTSVPIPVDILYNDGDMIVPRSVIDYLEARLPRCATHRMDASGHYPHISAPDQVAAQIFRILNAGVAK